MFSPIGKKKLIVELKRIPLDKREEYLKSHGLGNKEKKDKSVSPPRKERSPSPPRVHTPLIQTIAAGASATRNLDYILQEETLLGEVTRKIASVAVRYRRERDAVLLSVFNTNSLSYQEFRDHLTRSFRLKFTDEEFQEVIKLFDNDGDGGIDGSEFLVCFTKLASIVKAKEASKIREKQYQYEQELLQKEKEKQYNLEKKSELLVDYNFTDEIRERALMKMTEAAKKYDRNHPASVSLDGFTGQFLLPSQFKEILKRTFNLKLSPMELGALIKEFDRNQDGHVECSEFLITFFKLGFAAREKELTESREKQQRLSHEHEEKKILKLKNLEDKIELTVDYNFSEADEARMYAKIKESSKKYDRYHPSAMSLEGFNVQFMKPGMFREMVKRTFNLHLTGKELGAVVKLFDKVGDGTIPCRDFLMYFHEVGYEEKNHERLLQLQKQRELNRLVEEEKKKKLQTIEEKVTVEISENFLARDVETAYEKIKIAAVKYDRTHPSAMNLDGFDGSYLTPGVFREMLKRTFNIRLTPPELGAMVNEFDTEKNNKINCTEFLKVFFKLSFDEKSKIHHEILNKQREMEQQLDDEMKRKTREIEEKMKLEVNYSFSKHEKEVALNKIMNAAIKYDKNHPSAPCLDGFQGAFMTPYVFKDMLFRAFNIKLTPPELGAVMKEFDRDLSGTVDCSEFLNSFFRLGFQKRAEIAQKQAKKQKEANYLRERSELMKLQEQEKKMNLKIDWEFTDEDLNFVKEKMTEAAMKYDRAHPASVSLDGFESKILAPGIFREMIRRTFNIHLNPRQLAAMLTLFESDKEGNIETRNFLTKFMRIGLDERYKFKTDMIERQREAGKRFKKEREEKIANQWKKIEELVEVCYEFSDKDEESVMKKLMKSAMKYEKNSISSPSLDGFSCVFLQPGAFKELLKRTFNLNLNGKQLGVLVKRYEHEDHPNCVNCSRFIHHFLSLGHQERRKFKALQDDLQRKILKNKEISEEKKLLEQKLKNKLEMTSEYSEMDRKKMLLKLTEAAFKYDKLMPGAVSLDGFTPLYLFPEEFRELLKRTFHLKLEISEFQALFHKYDPHGCGKIISKDFLNDFLQLGVTEREKLKIKNLEKNRLNLKLQKQEEIRKLQESQKRVIKELPNEFTVEEQRSAFDKITSGAMRYDKTHPTAASLAGFDVISLTYGEFYELLKQTFHITLTEGELAAVCNFFDKKKESCIPSKDFLIYFLKLGNLERSKFQSEILKKQREMNKLKEREKNEKLELRWAQKELEIDWNFQEKDLNSAMLKLTEAAKDYDPNHPSSMSLSAFDTLTMTPAIFREMLKRIMNITLTHRELGALVSQFDREGDHTVTCADFLVKFLSLGYQERNKIQQINREKISESIKKREEEEEMRERVKREKMEAQVNYDFTHEQFASTMEKLKLAASTYDRNHPSAVSLDGFQGSNLTPGVFREMLKRTFNIKLDPGELGAAVKFFDSDGDGTIDTAEFLKHFFKLQRTERSTIRRQRIQAERDVKKKLEDEVKERIRLQAIEEETKMSFGPDDEKSLLEKISKLSEVFATDSSSFVSSMQAFKGPALPPMAFREVFYRVFLVRLTYPEVGALMSVLDEGGTGSIDGTKFMNAFFRLGRLQEKALLGEGVADISSLDCLKPSMEPMKSDSLFSGSPDRSSTTPLRTLHSRSTDTRPKSPEDFRHTSIQATDDDINNFTAVTLGQSWVLPTTIKTKTNSITKQNSINSHTTATTNTSSSSKNEILEQNFDDFEPFILVPRSPDSKVKYHPNLKDFPMPTPGPPQGKKTNFQNFKNKTEKNKNLKNNQLKPIEFQGLTLKKTSSSRHDGTSAGPGPGHSSLSSSSSSFSRPLTSTSLHDTQQQQQQPEVNGNSKILKKQKIKKNEKDSTAPFFFPALLSTAPQINLAPVGLDFIQQENILLYENTDTF